MGFCPLRRIGCVRTGNIAEYLTRAGWTLTVLTVDPSLWRDVEHPQQRGTSFHGDVSVGWVSPAERTCSNLTPKDVDVILASGPPFSAFSLAQRLARRLHCPYVLDYRDLWSRHLHNHVPTAVTREASVIAGSAAVTTVSPSWARVMDRQFGMGAKVHVVSNGYDPEDLASRPGRSDGCSTTMAVMGPMFAKRWSGSGSRTRSSRTSLSRRATALEAVKGAGVAVVITSVADNATLEDNGMVTGKIFEAIGLGTPVLVIAPDGSDANVVAETTGLGRRYPANDVDGIASFLSDLTNGKSLGPKDTAAYAWGNLVSTLDGVLRDAVRA